MPYIALGLAGLVALFLLLRLFLAMPAAQLVRGLYIGGAVVGAGTVLFLVMVGREGLAFALTGLAFPFLRRWWRQFRRAAPAAGQSSGIDTAWLAMTLDHETGRIDGKVLKGVHAGRTLSELDLDALKALWRGAASDDPASAQLLEAYLDRVHEGWREEAAAPPAGSRGMDRAEALRILGLEGEPDAAAIRAAHHRLMLANHPDHGGSAYLAAKINEARDLLLGS